MALVVIKRRTPLARLQPEVADSGPVKHNPMFEEADDEEADISHTTVSCN
jgi:hypothetical protein